MSKMVWDQTGERTYRTGVEQGAIFPQDTTGAYTAGEAWNGLTAVNESPSGAEVTALWANNKKYAELVSAEEFGGTIEAFMYPDGFAKCNGEVSPVKGMKLSQQARMPFGLVYKNFIGNDIVGNKYGYELNIVYGARVAPSEKANASVNESPDVSPMSWEFTTTPVAVDGYDPTSKLTFSSLDSDPAKLAELEAIIYGSEDTEPRLPLPAEILTLMGDSGAEG